MLPAMVIDTQSQCVLALAAQQGLLRVSHLQELGMTNSRLKDYLGLWILLDQ